MSSSSWETGASSIITRSTATRDRSGEPFVGHTGPVYTAAFSPDGTLLATGSGDGLVRLWDVATRKQISGPHLRHQQAVRSVVFSPDGRTLASGGEDSAVRLWDISYAADVQRTLCHAVGRSLTPLTSGRVTPRPALPEGMRLV
ncbi:WD40 repeat domain-containing protein [Saccharothrix sp. NRRL B-16314]|uniref:WD40 repeat domain-containing protein n=1 Tax=Saccharothrix sp. NRRL B-16314 TaxID=1463825 RepID=UPI0007C5CF7C|nr:hypothetical protein [Saccharothrix sp. NRRL B-16314]